MMVHLLFYRSPEDSRGRKMQIVVRDSHYIAMASAELKKRIEDELTIPDPPKEMAKAILQADEKVKRDS